MANKTTSKKCRICGSEKPLTREGFCFECHNKEIQKRNRGMIAEIIVQDDEWERERFYLTIYKEDIDNEQHVFYFADSQGRKIVSAIYKKDQEIVLNDTRFRIVEVIFHDQNYTLRKALIDIKNLDVVQDDKFNHYVSNRGILPKDILIWSNKYEEFCPIQVISVEGDNSYITSFCRYKEFYYKYGKGKLKIKYCRSNITTNNYESDSNLSGIRDKSLLSEFGYSVSNEKITEIERQSILEEIIKLDIASKGNVLKLLKFNLNTHKDDKYINARNKWEKDIEFVNSLVK